MNCDFNDGILTATIGFPVDNLLPQRLGAQPPGIMLINNIYNPNIPKTFTFTYYLVSGGVIVEWGQASMTISSFTVPNFQIYTPYLTASAKMPFFINFSTPIELVDGYFAQAEPSKSTVYIDIGFQLINFPNPWFSYDFGTLQPNGPIDCDIYGVDVSPFASSLQCILMQGPSATTSNTDYVYIRIANYGPVLVGTTFAINVPGTFCQSNALIILFTYS